LPAGAVAAAGDCTAPAAALATPVTPAALGAATGADLLARLKLAAAPAPTDPSAAPPAGPADAATAAQPFAKLDLPPTPDPAAKQGVAAASAAPAPPVQAQPAPPADVAAALAAALPQTTTEEPAQKPVRAGQLRDAEQVTSRSSAAAVATDLRVDQASPIAAPTPVGEVADAAARPVSRDATVDALTPATAVSPVDAPAAAPAAPPLAPAHSHASSASSTAAAQTLPGQGAPIDTRADNWHEALASRVQVLVDQHVGEAHIKLNPPELGAVDIKISLVDDKTFVQLTAGNSAARDELTQSLPRLRELLSASGLSLGGASVQGGSAGQSGQDAAPRVAVPAYAPFAAADAGEPEPVRAAARTVGRIDLFA
jgi:flagellar hook-length control protein FliK